MPQSNPKRIWLITYGASSPSITNEMLIAHGINADEIYTLEQRDLKYTLLNVKKRARIEQLEQCTLELQSSHRVILQEILGYQAITGFYSMNQELNEHPGFKLILSNMVSVHSWASFGDSSKGLLWKYNPHVDPMQLTKRQLVKLVNEYRKRKLEENEETNELIQAELAEQRVTIRKLEDENRRLADKVVDLRALYHASRR